MSDKTKKLICGPMATISHPAFRILIEKFGGCDEYFTEMINAGSLLNEGPFEKFYIDPSPVPEKLVWQLTGTDCERMKKAAEVLVKLPGLGLDVNMGCSAPDIYRYGAGIGWMLRPVEETREMVHEVSSVLAQYNRENPEFKKRFSIKLRLGDDNFPDEGFYSFCDMLVSEGAELLTLHPRTKKEKLTRPARYSYCQKLCERYQGSGVKIYLNGNVKDEPSLKNAVAAAPDVDGIMISRAAVQKPWIFSQLKTTGEGGDENKKIKINMEELCLEYIDLIEKYQPVEFWKTRLQRFYTYFTANFVFGHYAQTQFINAKDNDDLRMRIKEFFEKCPEERTRIL